MPPDIAAQVAWSQNMATRINGPLGSTYGLPDSMCESFETANTTLQAANLAAVEPTTRNRITIERRNNALHIMKAQARAIVSTLRGNTALTSDQLLQLGVTVPKTTRSASPVPGTSPHIKVTKTDGRLVTVELSQTKAKRGKPTKVAGAIVFTYVGATAPQGVDGWKFATATTRTTIELPFGPSAAGDTIWITAFWNNSRDESGPAAIPVSVNLPAGGTLPKEIKETLKLAA